ncbi:cytochrome c oxidase biogenesis protein Cmc1 like-domain-containing protein [Kalaharituber pfeilii]|nr:cytochrome c oxidase biogenesis protein Cmc1 like-domain-containing protein [Kalaharituber pfeilii]
MAHKYEFNNNPPSTNKPALPSSKPLPLSATQEQQVRDIYHARVRGLCAKEIKEFAECARNRTITATWKCKKQRSEMNSCMVNHATPEEFDRAREDWFRLRLEKRRLREEALAAGKIPTVRV